MNADYILIVYFTLLSKRRKVKRSQLAARAGISTRTVARCIDALTLAGVPVYSETGPDGGYYIPDDYIVSQASFSAEEKARIINCVRAAQPNFSDTLCDTVLDKMQCLAQSDENFLVKSDSLIIDASGWNAPQYASAKITVLGKAVEEKKTVAMKYIDRYESTTVRYFDPYCLVLKSGMWYVYGWCHNRRDFRLFKIARIKDIRITDTPFRKRPNDVYEKLRGDFNREDLVQFSIEFNNFVLPEIEEWLGPDAIEDHGRCYVAHAEMFGGNQLVSKLLSFGSGVKVLSPAPLREEVEVECKRMLSLYGDA